MTDKIFDISPSTTSKSPAMPCLDGESPLPVKRGKHEWLEIKPTDIMPDPSKIDYVVDSLDGAH